MENFSIQDEVRAQYNRAPYPAIGWAEGLFARCPETSVAHALYEAGAALVHGQKESHTQKKIALLGCGTFEPYAFGAWQPQAHIDAVDFSSNSIKKAKTRCHLRGVHHVNFHAADLVEFCRAHKNTFDYVQSFGVLHHLENPKAGFEALAQSLKAAGFARIMVYSKTSRGRPQLLREAARKLKIQDPTELKTLVELLPWHHPLKLSFLTNADNLSAAGVIDSSLHACEHAFNLRELLQTLDDVGLKIACWDLSQNLLNLLEEAQSKNLLEKIEELEAFDQWPSSFIFWAVKKERGLKLEKTHVYAPALPPKFWQKSVYSTLLRRTIKLSANDIDVWQKCHAKPQERLKLQSPFIEDLIAARFLLEVTP